MHSLCDSSRMILLGSIQTVHAFSSPRLPLTGADPNDRLENTTRVSLNETTVPWKKFQR
jgi:hypothetical protein